MSKNKIIFLILWFLVVLFVVFIVLTLNWNKERQKDPATSNDFTIWILDDNLQWFNSLIDNFKLLNKDYKDTKINIVTFSTYEDYYNTLIWAFLNWKWPDLFVLNNNDWNLFDNQIMWIDPNLINPDEFRKNYEILFSTDLIEKNESWTEYLRWIPLWYEVLWLFYNFRDLRWKKLNTWSQINDIVSSLASDDKSVIWLWNWITVENISDIITQFFIQDWLKKIEDLNSNELKNSVWRYFIYWDSKLDNKYDNFYKRLTSTWKNNFDLFSSWDVQIIVWYPKDIEKIDEKWFNKNFLRANTFPMYNENSWVLLAKYNYFVQNKNSKNPVLWNDILKYFSSTEWQKKYLELFPYYLPSLLSLVSERLEQNINSNYVIKYKDFYNSSFELTSFNKLNKVTYDKEIVNILDNSLNSQELFENFRKKLLCISSKMIKQENMSLSCNWF